VGEVLATITAKAAAKDQLDRTSTSIPLNIAEGDGKFSGRDRARFFETARRSALECAACLDALVVRNLTDESRVLPGKERLLHMARMLRGLLPRFSPRPEMIRGEDCGSEQD
jgi:four helix bundle protein